jgi:Domain of unknown function (DUF1905)
LLPSEFHFHAALWRYSGDAAWYFITVPEDVSARIKFLHATKRGFGSVRVKVQIGETEWKTSLFPDAKSGCYFLPVKAAVRKSEKLQVDADISVRLTSIESLL